MRTQHFHPVIGVLAILAAAVGLAAPASAQEYARLGLGVGIAPLSVISDDDLLAAGGPRFYVPILVGDAMAMEPYVGYFRLHQASDGGFISVDRTWTALQVGVGLFVMREAGDRGRTYFGPRLGLARFSSAIDDGGAQDDVNRTDLVFAVVAGGEFFLTERFSLGGEAGVAYQRRGDEKGSAATTADESGSTLRTTTEIRVRWYPW